MIIRELQMDDRNHKFLETLSALTDVNVTENQARSIHIPNNHIILVAEENNHIIGTATIIIEQKFIHGGGKAGHIEDVAVHKNHQGKGIGKTLIQSLIQRARKEGCYKILLHCNDTNRGFYTKLGFRHHPHAMRFDLSPDIKNA